MVGPALRRRLSALPVDQRISLRELVAEFGKHIPPEIAYRRQRRASTMAFGTVELTQEQMVALGRMHLVSEALNRIGAQFDGSRNSPDRAYWLPEDKREVPDARPTNPTFLRLPGAEQACSHLTARLRLIGRGKSRGWTQDDQRAAIVLMRIVDTLKGMGLLDDVEAATGGLPPAEKAQSA